MASSGKPGCRVRRSSSTATSTRRTKPSSPSPAAPLTGGCDKCPGRQRYTWARRLNRPGHQVDRLAEPGRGLRKAERCPPGSARAGHFRTSAARSGTYVSASATASAQAVRMVSSSEPSRFGTEAAGRDRGWGIPRSRPGSGGPRRRSTVSRWRPGTGRRRCAAWRGLCTQSAGLPARPFPAVSREPVEVPSTRRSLGQRRCRVAGSAAPCRTTSASARPSRDRRPARSRTVMPSAR